MKFAVKPTKRDFILLAIFIPTLFLVQRCYYPIIDYPEIQEKSLPAKKSFTTDITSVFPLGSSETALKEELVREKFVLWKPDNFSKNSEYNGGASYEIYPGLPHPSSYEWRILWKSENGRLVDIFTLFGSTCL